MRREIQIRTPENVVFGFRLAGFASRLVAAAIDYAIVSFLIGIVVSGLGFAALLFGIALPGAGDLLSSGMVALLIVGVFAILFGYFLFFELVWNGQTPGKRAVGIRVVQDHGAGITFGDSLVRNLVRVADALPGLYALGGLTLLLSSRNKRLGDHAAGTIVVATETVEPVAAGSPLPAFESGNTIAEDAVLAARVRAEIAPEELQLAREAWERREFLEITSRRRLMRRLADHLRRRFKIPPWGFLSDEQLLRDVLQVADPAGGRRT